MVAPNGRYVHQALDRFEEAREGARRFHGETIGKGIDPFYSFGDWLSLVRRNDAETIEKRYWSHVEKSAMNEFSGTAGGYTVPPELRDGMLRDLSTGSLWRRWGAYVQPMKSQQCFLPIPDVSTAQSAGVNPYLGGFQMSFLAEGNTFPSTAGIKFRQMALTAWEMSGYVYASNPFLQDAEGVDTWLRRLFAAGVAWYQDWFFFQGTGTGQPLGVINSGGSVTVTRGTPNTILIADAQSMIDNLLPSAWDSGAVWFCHPSTLAKITAFTGWFPNGELILFGLPIVTTGKCATLGKQGDLILAAPSLYIIGDRLQFEVALAPEEPTGFVANQTAFRVFSRVDGQPAVVAPITLADASSTVSPFVVLK